MSRNFNCTQPELIAVCMLGWESCAQHIKEFGNFKTTYNEAFIEDRRQEIKDCEKMPDFQQRSSTQEILRQDLKKQAEEGLTAWRSLRRYIRTAWPDEEESGSRVKNAGQIYYEAAYNQQWESVMSLLSNGGSFIAENKAVLTESGGMPADFAESYAALEQAYQALYLRFLDSRKLSDGARAAKLQAYNKLFDDLTEMFADAAVIFRKQPDIRRHFIFESALVAASGQNGAGIKGTVSNGILPPQAIEGVVLRLRETGEETDTDEDGRYFFGRLAAGVYTLQVSAPGYQTQTVEAIEVKTGTQSKINVLLAKEETPEDPDL